MPIESPLLDDLRFDRVVEELIRRIPVYAPEWTNYNDSDPGITFIQLFAYLAEQIGYRLNKIPEKNHVELLKLLGIRLAPAHAATTRVAFLLTDPSNLLGVTLPAASRVTTQGSPQAVFETDLAVDLVPAQPVVTVATRNPFLWDLLLRADGGYDTPRDSDLPASVPAPDGRWLTLGWDGDKPSAKDMPVAPIPLSPPTAFAVPHPYLWIGLAFDGARDAGFLGASVTLTVQLDDDEQPDPRAAEHCAQATAPGEDAPPPIQWLAYFDADAGTMKPIPGRIDDLTAQLTRSGTIRFTVPFGLGAIPLTRYKGLRDAVSPSPVDTCSAVASGLASTITSDGDVVTFNAASFASKLTGAVNAATASVAATRPAIGHPLDPRYTDPTRVRGWLRLTLLDPATRVKVRHIGFNVVPVTNTITVTGERLGQTDGRPGQQLRLAHGNVVADTLEIAIAESSGPGAVMTTWRPIETLEAAGPSDRVYALDPEAGLVTFGDGQHGRIPPLVPAAGAVVALRYRHGGGVAGEAAVGDVNVSAVQITGVAGVVNIVSATGGRDAETLDHAKLRARKLLASRTRAVTAADFEWFARETPEVRVARAIVVPRRRPLPATFRADERRQLVRRAAQAMAEAKELRGSPTAASLVPGASTPVLLAAGVAPCGPPLPLPPAGLDDDFEAPGAVSVVVVPDQPGFEPLPAPSFLRAVCRQLDRYRLVTTEIYVVPPQYLRICDVTLRVKARPGYTRAALADRVRAALSTYLDVLRGGDDGAGAPFGAQVHIADLIAHVFRTEGVERVDSMTARFVRTKSNAEPRAGALVICPTAADEFDHVDLAAEETTSLETTTFALSTV